MTTKRYVTLTYVLRLHVRTFDIGFQFCILAFDTEKRELHTVSNGDMKDRVGRPLESGKRGIVDPKGRMIAMALYEGK
jgi:hypothetical protein